MLATACTTEQKVPVTVTPQTAGGAAAQVENLRVTVQNGDGTVEGPTAENPLSFFVVSGPAPGVTNFLVEADADLGEGEVLIQDTIELTVSGAQAETFGMTAGTPVAKNA